MNWYKNAQYKTKEDKEITFQELPFNENNDKRGWIVHRINAFINNEYAGYINLSYIPKEKWDSIYHGNIWKFRHIALGHYDIKDELIEKNDDQAIAEDHFQKYGHGGMSKELYDRMYHDPSKTYEECMVDDRENATYWMESEKEKALNEYKMFELYFVDKPIVDFIRTEEKFQRQHVALSLHQYANEWLQKNFGLHLWLSYCRTDMGKCFYDSKMLELKKYRYKTKMRGGYRQTREYMAFNLKTHKTSANINQLNQIATQFRQQQVKCYDDECLRNKCLPISRKLKALLLSKGFNTAIVTQGIFKVDNPNPEAIAELDPKGLTKEEFEESKYTPLHYWVEVNNVIIDVTASQFNDELESPMNPIEIGTYEELERYVPIHKDYI